MSIISALLLICLSSILSARDDLTKEACTGEILFQSDFVGDAIPSKLEVKNGKWRVEGGRFIQSAISDNTSSALITSGDRNNYRIKARVRILDAKAGALAGVMARVQPDGSGYMLCLHVRSDGRQVLQLRHDVTGQPEPCFSGNQKLVGDIQWHYEIGDPKYSLQGNHTLTGDIAFVDNIPFNKWHTLTLDCYGNHFVGYLDGRAMLGYSFGIGWHSPELLTEGPIGLFIRRGRVEFDDLMVRELTTCSHMATQCIGLYDTQGRLEPCISYAEFLERNANWQLNFKKNVLVVPGQGSYKLGNETYEVTPQGFKDAQGHVWPAYCMSLFMRSDNIFYWEAGLASWPGITFVKLIEGCLSYYAYSGRPECLELAREAGDWLLKGRLPEGCKIPFMTQWWNTSNGECFGNYPYLYGDPHKAEDLGLCVPMFGRALLKLYGVTEDQRYLNAAIAMGEAMRQLQLPNGSWNARVRADTGEPYDPPPNDWIFTGLLLMQELADVTGDNKWLEVHDLGLNYVLQGALKTLTFHGPGHGLDAPAGTQMVSCVPFQEMMHYLIKNLPAHPEYRALIKRLDQYGEKIGLFIRDEPLAGGYSIQEVAGLEPFWLMDGTYNMEYVGIYATLYELTKDIKYKNNAFLMFNTSTYYQYASGQQRLHITDHFNSPFPSWNTGMANAIRFMSVFPEAAPRGENHMLRWSSEIQTIDYRRNIITYRTCKSGEEMFILGLSKPHQVLVDGKPVPGLNRFGSEVDGWNYDEDTQIMRVRHSGRNVEVSLVQEKS